MWQDHIEEMLQRGGHGDAPHRTVDITSISSQAQSIE
jgi:hypothetical protein